MSLGPINPQLANLANHLLQRPKGTPVTESDIYRACALELSLDDLDGDE